MLTIPLPFTSGLDAFQPIAERAARSLPALSKAGVGDVVGVGTTATRTEDGIDVSGTCLFLKSSEPGLLVPITFETAVEKHMNLLTQNVLRMIACCNSPSFRTAEIFPAVPGWNKSSSTEGYDMLELHILRDAIMLLDVVHDPGWLTPEELVTELPGRNHQWRRAPVSAHEAFALEREWPGLLGLFEYSIVPEYFRADVRVENPPSH